MKALITDTRLKTIKVQSDKKDRHEHNRAVAVIVAALFHENNKVNYDHIKLTLPKATEIPLEIHTRKGKKRTDVAFHLPTGTLVHVEVKVHPKGTFITPREIKELQDLTKRE